MKKRISKNIIIEELIKNIPESENFLFEHGIINNKHISGTLESVCLSKGLSDEDIIKFVTEINEL